MRRILLVLMLLLLAGGVLAQAPGPINPPPALLNFQGRLAKPDGTPVADATNYALTLSLWDTATVGQGTMRWQQTFSNVTVHNGVFALILNLSAGFTTNNNLDTTFNNNTYLQIQVGTNSPISPRQQIVSTAYALKAGSVPDGSITAAKLASDARSVTGAAGGDLTGAFPTPQIKTDSSLLNKVSGTLLTIAAATTVTDIMQLTVTATVTSSAWQSFMPKTTGTLAEIDVYCGTSGASIPATLSLYAGQGTNSTPLQTVPITVNPSLGLQSFPITTSVTAGQTYTWAIGSNNNLLFGYAGGNPYPGGLTDLGTTFDYAFQTLMKSTTAPTTQINAFANLNVTGTNSIFLPSGSLGIGTSTPTAPLEINGLTKIDGKNVLQFGAGLTGQQVDAGKIGYEIFTVDSLDIVGAGTTGTNRKVRIYAEGGTTLNGNMVLTGTGNGVIFPDGTKQTTAPVFSGAAAGGDLTGTFPNPLLATLATSLNKVSGGVMTSSSGNIGVGTSSPTNKLQVNPIFHASNGYGLTVSNASYGANIQYNGGAGGFGLVVDKSDAGTGSTLLTLRSNVAAGANTLFSVSDSGQVNARDVDVTTLDSAGRLTAGGPASPIAMMEVLNANSNPGLRVHIRDSFADAIRIKNDSVANKEVGMYVTQDTGHVGNFRITNNAQGTPPIFAELSDSGTWSATSDRRMKTDITTMTGLLEKTLALRPVSYFLKNQDRIANPLRQMGFIAQEVEPLFPTLVHGEGDAIKSLDYASLTVAAVGSIQELHALLQKQAKEIETLREQQKQIDALKEKAAKVDALETRLAEIVKTLAQLKAESR